MSYNVLVKLYKINTQELSEAAKKQQNVLVMLP